MKAMIFAAGLGTRLKPITNKIPKALVPLAGKPLLFHQVNTLKKAGVNSIIINVHHHAQLIIDYLSDQKNFGIQIEISEEESLLDTGGGLKKASWFFDNDQPFVVHNVDVISSINIQQMINFHKQNNVLATVAVKARKTTRYLILDAQDYLIGWQSVATGEKKLAVEVKGITQNLSFLGIHVMSPKIFGFLPQDKVFSLIEAYLHMANNQQQIMGFKCDHQLWWDLGKKEDFPEAERFITKLGSPGLP
jgi:NDP-sugar pyrophosphorylase family protein